MMQVTVDIDGDKLKALLETADTNDLTQAFDLAIDVFILFKARERLHTLKGKVDVLSNDEIELGDNDVHGQHQ
ncbi:MAG: hypothetical protein AAF708_19405 [Deinococcota bacterium]